jgi:hypothetical protein
MALMGEQMRESSVGSFFRRTGQMTQWQVSWLAAGISPGLPMTHDHSDPVPLMLLTVAETASAFNGIPFLLTIKLCHYSFYLLSGVKRL